MIKRTFDVVLSGVGLVLSAPFWLLFAAAIIIAGFVPLFTLSGIEGHIFGPMAKTYGYAIAGDPNQYLATLGLAYTF